MGLPFGLVDWFILVWILNALHILPFSFWVFGLGGFCTLRAVVLVVQLGVGGLNWVELALAVSPMLAVFELEHPPHKGGPDVNSLTLSLKGHKSDIPKTLKFLSSVY